MPALTWFHPCELQPACQCDYVHVELILMVPEEEYPRCFECAKPLRARGLGRHELLWAKIVGRILRKSDPGAYPSPSSFRISYQAVGARSRTSRGRSATTDGEAAAAGLTPVGASRWTPYAHLPAVLRALQRPTTW